MRDVTLWLEVMCQQLDGAMQASERGALQAVECLNGVHPVSVAQFERIRSTEAIVNELTRLMKEKATVGTQLRPILQTFVEKQETDVLSKPGHVKRLQEVQALTPLVDVIDEVKLGHEDMAAKTWPRGWPMRSARPRMMRGASAWWPACSSR